jgi:IclR family transcriptional regulator, acetate operon repressor
MLKSLSGALQLMTYFTARQPVWGVRELAKASGVHYAVVHRVLATFAESGFLVQDEVGRYALGLRWFEMGETARKAFSPSDIVQPALERLAQQIGETVFLSWLDGHDGLCVDIVQSQHELRFSIELGQRFALYAGSHGKAILAFQPEALREQVYAAAGQDGAAVETHLARIREDGWAHTQGETAPGVAGLAVPLWSKDRATVVGSLAISGPQQRLTEDAIPRLLEALRAAQAAIAGVVGFIRQARS